MTTLTADEAMLAVLRQANGLAEIRDPSGAIVGFFAPVSLERAHLHAQAAARIDPTEIKRRKESERQGHTTREVFEHLKSLTADPAMQAYLRQKIEARKETAPGSRIR